MNCIKRIRKPDLEGKVLCQVVRGADDFDNSLNMHSRFTVAQAEAGLEHVVQHSGTRFDPRVVKAFSGIVLDEDSVLPETDEVEITTKDLRTGMACRGIWLPPVESYC